MVRSHRAMANKPDFDGPLGDQVKQARSFGLIFAVFFGILALWPLFEHKPIRIWASVLVAIWLLLSFLLPHTLIPLSRQWLRLGTMLHQITSPFIMGVLFFLVLTPTSFLIRLRKHDALSLSFDPKRLSYWVDREKHSQAPENMKNQF